MRTLSDRLGSVIGPRTGKHKPHNRTERRSWPIHGYVGPNGSGKSAAMVWDTLPSLEQGRYALSTVRILDYNNPRPCEGYRYDRGVQVPCELCEPIAMEIPAEGPQTSYGARPMGLVVGVPPHRQAHPLWIPFTNWEQLLEARKTDALLDEVTGVASSRESHSMPAPVANKLVQMRRADVTIRWSAPSWKRADVIIRECSQAVTHCVGRWPVRAYDDTGERAWRERRLFSWSTYDADDFEDFTAGKREQLQPLTRDKYWGPGSIVFDAYDTLGAVLTIGTVTDSGRCYHCAGTRKAPECSCPDYHHRKNAAREQIAGLSRARPEAEHDTRPSSRPRPSRVTPADLPAPGISRFLNQ